MRDPHIDKLINDLKAEKFRKGEGKKLTETYGEEITKQLTPLFENHSKAMTESVANSLKGLKMPDMPAMPEQKFPEQQAPIVNVPAPIVNIPAPQVTVTPTPVTFPDIKFPEQLPYPTSFTLDGVNKLKPLPVMMVDNKGNPAQFPTGGSSGPGFPMRVLDESTNALRVTGNFSVTASNNSTQSIDSSGNPYSQANPLPVVFSSTGSTASALIDSTGVQYSGSNPFPVTITSGASATSATNIVDSSGVAYSGSNPVPVTFSAASSQNVNVFDAQQSTITSHAGRVEDFRGLDTVQLGVINVQSALNSTTTTLTSASTFTGTAEDIKDFASVSVQVFADQVSATDGLSIQQSGDGTNWDITDTYTIPANTGKTFSVQPTSRYFRIVYTNGGTGQTAFRLYPTFHYHASQPSSQRTSDAYTNETDLQQFWSFNSHYNGSTWDRQSNQSGVSTNALRVQTATDNISSVNVVSSAALTVTSITNTVATALVDSSGVQYSGSNPFIVDSNDALGQGDTATAIRIVHAGDSATSVSTQAVGLNETNVGVLRTVVMTDSVTSVNVVSSAALTVTSITNTVAAANIDSSGVQYSGSNPFPFTLVTSATATLNAAITDSGGVQYSGSNPLPITVISGALISTLSVGDSASRSADNGGNPVKVGGIARTTNPTAYADGDRSNLATDKLGRLITRPIQVRDLIATAYATLSTGTETTLLAGIAGTFLDPILITGTNTSTAAIQVDLRAVTAGNIVQTWMIPASTGPIGLSLPIGWPQDATGNNWTIDMGDFTNTNLYFSALFSKEL